VDSTSSIHDNRFGADAAGRRIYFQSRGPSAFAADQRRVVESYHWNEFHLIERRRGAVWAFAIAVGVSAALACATGPKDTLSGNWTGSGFSLSLRQSGSRVTGTSCTVVPVSGSVQGSDFELAIDTGASAVDYTGAFVNATTISLNQTGNVNVAVGGITLYKGPPSLSADCIFSQQ
jgi:hypothetical protein